MIKVLLSGVGRRVELVNFFKENGFFIVSLDIDLTAPALYFSHKFYKNLNFDDENFINNIVNIINNEGINLVFSLIDLELPIFAKNKEKLENIFSFFPNYNVVNTTYNKLLFFEYFNKLVKCNIIPTLFLNDLIENEDEKYKTMEIDNFVNCIINDNFLAVKPVFGSSSKDFFKIKNIFKKFNNLKKLTKYLINFFEILNLDLKNFIIQKYIDYNEEVTVDIFYDLDSKVVELCQRKRLKVRSGEVERAVTVKYPFLTSFILYLSDILIKNDFKLVGPVNFQFLIRDEVEFYLSEINTRFGGGYPLSYYSNANFFEHIKNIFYNKNLDYFLDSRYKENIYMLRYDSSFIIENL